MGCGRAVTLVIAYHAFPGVLPGGFTGVDVFFVISGYLITRLISGPTSRQFDPPALFRRR
jgi:peptidoglycan/LPS O-acetylase OafA/YrhL